MKNIYMLQPCDTHGSGKNESAYLPYATGLLIAYAFQNETVRANYRMKRFIYKKEDLDEAIGSMESPAVVGFSTYLWNFEYNIAFARRLKERYPDCVIVFGGHNVYNHSAEQLNEYPFIDFLIHGEGEPAFLGLLLHLCTDGDFSSVPNLSYRKDGVAVKNPMEKFCTVDYPSPYLEGWFDEILENDDLVFSALMETNRGCPFHCAYCDWGSIDLKMRQFPLERVVAEMEWFAEKKIAFCFCIDSNFGMFPRDYEIVDAFLEIKARTGYPEMFKCCTTEGGGDKEFNINKKLNDCGILKGASLALQTLSSEALTNIGRRNMSLEKYSYLTAKYNAAGIPTYSELIYGMPGETYDSFADNMSFMLESGTTKGCFVHYCELLPNSALGDPANVEKFAIRTAKIPYTQFHCHPEQVVPEYSNIIISTYSMDYPMWVRTVRFGLFVQCFHFMGLLQCFAKYMFFEKGLSYRAFYERLIDFALAHPETLIGSCCKRITANLSAIDRGETISRVFVDPDFGGIEYPMEEGMCLEVMREKDRFFAELAGFIDTLAIEPDLCADLLKYQRALLRGPGETEKTERYEYDLMDYFNGINVGAYAPPVKRNCEITYENGWRTESTEEYAMRIVWYGRKAARTMYSGGEMQMIQL